jgi:hypothetical protein
MKKSFNTTQFAVFIARKICEFALAALETVRDRYPGPSEKRMLKSLIILASFCQTGAEL